ncbi:protein kinase [Mycolicibacter sp. MYC123]|uniref:non-specific serine/threonine protein kinase n=1 Tax=[Mycobacterium] zoologicum TaxID=2872311 RepID=A0ABU5YQQ0_9MYCO|nr:MULTISPECIES: protein kinase [unclassified Mycolicibacter]MEB3051729.1 protein kinase [Mycolicibacter sp. MYC123]MEB3065459.1 protein kinase [Mycolicibacter sp. MYC101]
MTLEAGAVFAGYRIERLLGSGAMGEVYLARHPRLPRHDALKVLSGALTADDEFRQRFQLEADVAAGLFHPDIVGVHDRGEFDGRLWIAMDYVDGTDAAALIANRFPNGMPEADALAIITAIAGALDHAHHHGLLHRDVKPANIMVAEPDDAPRRILLADFGIARQLGEVTGLTATNFTVGTLSYAAPEQLMGETLDGRADQYALAATAFHLLTGVPPFRDDNPVAVISRHLSAPPPRLSDRRPELAHLDAVVLRALAKDPAGRFDSCADFAEALAGATVSEVVPAGARRRRWPWVAGGAAVLAGAAGALGLVGTDGDPDGVVPAAPTTTVRPAPITVTVSASAPPSESAPLPPAPLMSAPPPTLVPPPVASAVPVSPPAGASAICRDGTYSFSRHRSGACSNHAGVGRWLNPPPE